MALAQEAARGLAAAEQAAAASAGDAADTAPAPAPKGRKGRKTAAGAVKIEGTTYGIFFCQSSSYDAVPWAKSPRTLFMLGIASPLCSKHSYCSFDLEDTWMLS